VVQLVSKLFISVHVRIYTMVQIKKIWPVAKAWSRKLWFA